jgi:hypothetical protein
MLMEDDVTNRMTESILLFRDLALSPVNSNTNKQADGKFRLRDKWTDLYINKYYIFIYLHTSSTAGKR